MVNVARALAGGHPLPTSSNRSGRTRNRARLVAISGADGDALASLGATARQNRLAALGFHALPESVHLGTAAAIGLECPLRHLTSLLLLEKISMHKEKV
jgi:hypothetical protein